MTEASPRPAHAKAARKGLAAAWRLNGLVWLGLIGLLLGSAASAFAPLGRWQLGLDVGIGLLQACAVGYFSMGLGKAPALNRLASATALVFLVVLFALTFSDLFTRA